MVEHPSVCPFVCLSRPSTAAAARGGFAVERSANKRSIASDAGRIPAAGAPCSRCAVQQAPALSSKCGQCHV